MSICLSNSSATLRCKTGLSSTYFPNIYWGSIPLDPSRWWMLIHARPKANPIMRTPLTSLQVWYIQKTSSGHLISAQLLPDTILGHNRINFLAVPGQLWVVSNHWTGFWTGLMDWIIFELNLLISPDLQPIRRVDRSCL